MKKIENYIHGKISSGNSSEYLPVDDPSTGEIVSEVINSNKDDYNNLINSSIKAYEEWSKVTPLNFLSKFLNWQMTKIFLICM